MLGDGQSRLQLAPNLTYLGRLGAVEIEGLVVAYVSGLYPPHSDKALTNSVAVGLSVALHSIREALRVPAASQPRFTAMNTQSTRLTNKHARRHVVRYNLGSVQDAVTHRMLHPWRERCVPCVGVAPRVTAFHTLWCRDMRYM